MEEKLLFKDGVYAVTTHRIIAGSVKLDREDMRFPVTYMLQGSDWWKGASILAAIGVLFVFWGALWSIGVGLALFICAYWFYRTKEYKILILLSGDESFELKLRDRRIYNEFKAALDKMQKYSREEHTNQTVERVIDNLQSVESLPRG